MSATTLDGLEGYRRTIKAKAETVAEPAATPPVRERDGKGHFVKVGNAPKPKAIAVVPEVVEDDEAEGGFALVLTDLGHGGKDGQGKRWKATVVSGEDSGHKVRFLVYTDTEAEMAVCLDLLGLAVEAAA
jgi:hypothetical protein